MDFVLFCTIIGAAVAVIASVYQFLRNFKIDIKTDINGHIDRLEKRMNNFENKINSIEERMFWMATGKKLEDAILEERIKRGNLKTDP